MTERGIPIPEWADQHRMFAPGRRMGKTMFSESAPWVKDALAAAMSPSASRLKPKDPNAWRDGESHLAWFLRVFGEPFTDGPMVKIEKSSSVGLTEIPMVIGNPYSNPAPAWRAAASAASPRVMLSMFDAASDEAYREKIWRTSWSLAPNGSPVLSCDAVWIGADYATDRVEWDVSAWGRCRRTFFGVDTDAEEVGQNPSKPKSRKELVSSSAVDRALSQNDGLNKVKSVRSTKRQNRVIRELVVQNCAPPRNVVRKRGHGHA